MKVFSPADLEISIYIKIILVRQKLLSESVVSNLSMLTCATHRGFLTSTEQACKNDRSL